MSGMLVGGEQNNADLRVSVRMDDASYRSAFFADASAGAQKQFNNQMAVSHILPH